MFAFNCHDNSYIWTKYKLEIQLCELWEPWDGCCEHDDIPRNIITSAHVGE